MVFMDGSVTAKLFHRYSLCNIIGFSYTRLLSKREYFRVNYSLVLQISKLFHLECLCNLWYLKLIIESFILYYKYRHAAFTENIYCVRQYYIALCRAL